MSQTQSSPFAAESTAADAVSADELAARLASKLCHDFISPAGAIVSGLDLLDDPSAKDMRDEAMELIAASARKLTDLLQFSRVAFGASSGSDGFDTGELERLAQGVFAHARAELDWAIEPQSLPKRAAVVLLNLAQLAVGILPMGGTARAEVVQLPGARDVIIRATGPRARLNAEVMQGLAGQPLGDGLGGRWVQAYYVHVVAKAGGGMIGADVSDEAVTLRAQIPG
ncbi:MAG TPA: histidine phosphotransferase family protein [Caulobacteraceae bacterium]